MKITVYNENKRKFIEGTLAIALGVDNSICSYYRIYPSNFLENGKTEHAGVIESIQYGFLSSDIIESGEIIFISNDYLLYRIEKDLLIEVGNYANGIYDINRNKRIILKNAIPLVKTFMDEYSKSLIDIPEFAFQTMSDQVKSLNPERNSHIA